jgi:C4-type Zn-finger protein
VGLIVKDVHTEHCCAIHGCKYGNEDCTVYSGGKAQSYVCETCSWSSNDLAKALARRDVRAFFEVDSSGRLVRRQYRVHVFVTQEP